MTQPLIGLALGSGIARGWAHIGVIRALKRAGIEPDIIAGTSIGAAVGASHLCGRLDELEEWALSLNRMRMLRYFDVRVGGGGLIAGRRLAGVVGEILGDTKFEDLNKPLSCVTTELETGHEVWVRKGSLARGVAASYALPGIFSPVRVEGRWLVDGALVNPVPVSVCRALGARIVIAVNLNADIFGRGPNLSDEGDDSELSEEDAGISDLLDNASLELSAANPTKLVMQQLFGQQKNVPSMFNVMLGALTIIQDRLNRSRMAGDPPDVSVAPRLGHIGMLEFHRARESVEAGEVAVERAMPYIRNALSILGPRG